MKNIITIGGGTGSYTVLSGLKNITNIFISALVSMSDDGGSTGVLRDELGVLPPGDVRQCLVALSEHTEIVRKLMNYRFDEGTLKGHSFGNIFLAALEKVTGDFINGVEVASEILKVKGVVIPVTNNKAELSILLSDGTIVEGENKINHTDLQSIGIQNIFYKNNNVELNKHAREALLKADYIILGPGNYYCSVIPNIIVNGFKEALKESKAKIIFPINLTNKLGHTMSWKVSDYLLDIERRLEKKVDFILVNNEMPTAEQLEHYKLKEGDGVLVENNIDDVRVVVGSFLSRTLFKKTKEDVLPSVKGFIRHDSGKLAESISQIISKKAK